jgi:hypothetical protein
MFPEEPPMIELGGTLYSVEEATRLLAERFPDGQFEVVNMTSRNDTRDVFAVVSFEEPTLPPWRVKMDQRMSSQERKALVETALAVLARATADDAFLILAQEGVPENYVQTPDGVYVEVSLRMFDSKLPCLFGEQIESLRALGFNPGMGHAVRFFDGPEDPALPGAIERVFREVYEAPEDYGLAVDLHAEDEDLDKRLLAGAFPPPYDQVVAGWLGIELG